MEKYTVQEAINYMMDGHLPNCVFDGEVIDDGDQLLCSTETVADLVANYIDELCGDRVSHTGYYDPEEDERSGEVDDHTGWYYVDFD